MAYNSAAGVPPTMPGLWYEQFRPGDVIEHDARLTVTQDDNAAFCRLTKNEQPLHLDRGAAQAQGFKDTLVNGLYTFSASVGMSVGDLTAGTLVANLGYYDVEHPRPVYPGDELRVHSKVVEKRLTSKPGRGLVTIQHSVRNQDDDEVCRYRRIAMVRCDPDGPAEGAAAEGAT